MTRHLDPGLFRAAAISQQTRVHNEALAQNLARLPVLSDLDEMRRRFACGDGPIPTTPKSPRASTLTIPRQGGGEVSVRIIAPAAPKGVFLHIHGGGWAMGAADMRDGNLERIAKNAQLACVCVEYRLAPEHPFPAGPDDCLTAALWLIDNAEQMFGTKKLVIGGESAGAHLSVLTLLRLRAAGHGGAFCGANLIFGAYDLSLTPSALRADATLVTNRQSMERARAAFLPACLDRRNPDVSPLYADLHNLPPALFTIGTLDPLLDDSLFMHARWVAAGSDAELAVYPGGVHGFTAFDDELAQRANSRIDSFLVNLVGGG